MRVKTSISGLGAGRHDGETAVLKYGTQTTELTWYDAAGKWISEPRDAIRFRDLIAMRNASGPSWGYFSFPDTLTTSAMGQVLYRTGEVVEPWGWNPQGVRDAGAAYSAGLILEDYLAATWWSFNANSNFDLGLVWYPMNPGDWVSPLIVPDDHVGAILPATPTIRCWSVREWAPSGIDVPTKQILAPHLYSRYVSGTDAGCWAEGVHAQWRWTGTP